ncbi:hypothetical protein LTR86_008976 [Recurvomyces mirabilis]|nr:hypothetical protein LTR86_008976 [Recurvomyces mirabilis]
MTTGTAEYWEIYKQDGLNHVDKKMTNPGKSGEDVISSSVKIRAVHGILNTVAFAVSGTGVLLSVLTLPGVAVSAALGAELVYGKGIGVQRMGPAREEKESGMRENVEKAKIA